MIETQNKPLCVDLDGTLIKTDLLHESLARLLKSNPLFLLLLPFWVMRGKAFFKTKVSHLTNLNLETIPLRNEVVSFLATEKKNGRSLILSTGSHQILAERIAQRLDPLFETVIGSSNKNNIGDAKAAKLVSLFGVKGFDYIGDSSADFPVWKVADKAHAVHSGNFLLEKLNKINPNIGITFPKNDNKIKDYWTSLRPHQWVKNLLLFVPFLLAHRSLSIESFQIMLFAFFAFSFCASSVYLLNDILDLENDRLHDRKKIRPLASGNLSISNALAVKFILLILSFLLASTISFSFLMILTTYYFLTLAYSLKIKSIILFDVFSLASLYSIRLFAGHAALNVPFSPWLLGFSLFFFLSLALLKRFSELKLGSITDSFIAGRGYRREDSEQLSNLGSNAGYISILIFALYINSAEVKILYLAPEVLWLACPVLLYWMSRLWLLANRGLIVDDPVLFAIKDKISILCGVLILLVAAVSSKAWMQ